MVNNKCKGRQGHRAYGAYTTYRPHRFPYHLLFIIYCLLFLPLVSCSSDQEEAEDAFPSLITEMALLEVGETTSNITMYTDSGKKYRVAGELEGLKPRTWGRGLFGYVLQDASTVEVRTLQNVPVLPNSSELSPLKRDPVDVVSAWMGGGFVNIHLQKKTKGGDHTWGFILDGSYANTAGGTTYEVSLYHDQSGDPTAYSMDVYFSIDEDALSKHRITGDSVRLSIATFETEPYHWHFPLTPQL